MARVEWALLCDLAYFDAYRNLCMIGVRAESPVPTLPAGMHRFAIAARVAGLRPSPPATVSVTTPDGSLSATKWCLRVEVEAIGDYMLVQFGGVPPMREGIYRLEVSVDAREPLSIYIPVLVGA
jgi:hypothetical protein